MTSNTTQPATAATTSHVSRRDILRGTAVGATMAAIGASALAAETSTMADLIAAHRTARERFEKADRFYEETEAAIRASFEAEPLCLPCRGPTFAAVRSIGAERVIEQRNAPRAFSLYGPLGPCVGEEADRLRRFEAEIIAREERFGWTTVCEVHAVADEAEAIAWNTLVTQRPANMAEAVERFAYILEARPGEELDGAEFADLARSFLRAA